MASRRLGRAGLLLGALLIGLIGLIGWASPAQAHPISTTAVLLDVGTDTVTGTIELPLDELGIARDEKLTASSVTSPGTLAQIRGYVAQHLSVSDAAGRAWLTQVSGGSVRSVDGRDDLVLRATLRPSAGTVGDFVLHYDAILDEVVAHRVFVSARYGTSGDYTLVAMLSWQRQSVPIASAASPTSRVGQTATSTPQRFVSAVGLGIDHISSGSDHLLFLIMLLVPAPLLVTGRGWSSRWARRTETGEVGGVGGVCGVGWRVVHVVTAFAGGHSVTLALGAIGWVDLPSRLVEAGIALSVLVSALHATKPLVRRGEVLVAGGFGLLHGLAFATLLGEMDLSRGSLVTTLLGFNLGIELTQLLVVAAVMPSLVVLSRTPLYPALRLGLAGSGAAVAAGWFAERTGVIASNPLNPVGELLVEHPVALALGLAALALAGRGITRGGASRERARPRAVLDETTLPDPRTV